MSETLPAAELAAEAEQIRGLALLGLAAALDRGEKRARFISERRRLVAENALFDEERQDIVANRCDAELAAAAALAEAAEEP